MTKRKTFNMALVFGLISSLMLSTITFSAHCQEMYDNIIRIRILANSDSKEDQDLKLLVRDEILNVSKEFFANIDSYDDAVVSTRNNLDQLCYTAQKTVANAGYDYGVSVELREEYFDTRIYEDFTLPAGRYETAVFTIGDGGGQNWWCVIYPQVCVGACSGSLTDTLSDESAKIAYNYDDYVIKFKTVEIYEKIRKYLTF